jgi:hypothetical protein
LSSNWSQSAPGFDAVSIGKRVAEAVEKMAKNDAEGALLPISSAADATATKKDSVGVARKSC